MATKKGITLLSGLFGRTLGKGIDKKNLNGWFLVLEPIPDELLLQAGLLVVRSKMNTFEIAPGEVFQAAMSLKREEFPTEMEAWRLACTAAAYSVHGDGQATTPEVYWEDLPTPVKAVAKAIGRDTLAATKTGDSTTRAHFIHEYKTIVAKETRTSLRMLFSSKDLEALRPAQEAIDAT